MCSRVRGSIELRRGRGSETARDSSSGRGGAGELNPFAHMEDIARYLLAEQPGFCAAVSSAAEFQRSMFGIKPPASPTIAISNVGRGSQNSPQCVAVDPTQTGVTVMVSLGAMVSWGVYRMDYAPGSGLRGGIGSPGAFGALMRVMGAGYRSRLCLAIAYGTHG